MIFSVCGARPCFESVLRAREIERERETPTRENVNLNPISLPKPPLCERALTLLFVSSARTLWSCVVLLRDDCCSILVSRDQKLNPERDRVERERGTKRCVCVCVCAKNVCPHTVSGENKTRDYKRACYPILDSNLTLFRFVRVLVRSLSQGCFREKVGKKTSGSQTKHKRPYTESDSYSNLFEFPHTYRTRERRKIPLLFS